MTILCSFLVDTNIFNMCLPLYDTPFVMSYVFLINDVLQKYIKKL